MSFFSIIAASTSSINTGTGESLVWDDTKTWNDTDTWTE